MDDWSVDGLEDVFAEGSESLDEVMDSLANGLDVFYATNFQERDIGRGMQIVSRTMAGLLRHHKKERKPILKKLKTTSGDGRELSNALSLKKVTFDIEKFAADECGNAEERGEARAQLAVKLGARPLKNNYFNYKRLKEELNVKKDLKTEFDKLSALESVKKLSMKKKVKKKLSRR